MAEILRTNQIQMQLLAEMTKTLGKVADILIPSGAPVAGTGRYGESWLIEEETADGSH
jgi:hypothetical protein